LPQATAGRRPAEGEVAAVALETLRREGERFWQFGIFSLIRHPWAASERREEELMLGWAAVFFIIAIIAGVLGFGGIAAGAAQIAQILFVVFIILFVISLLVGILRGRPPTAL
jgi:uncharacterized membrane protein YtjA (UPF0391 family)